MDPFDHLAIPQEHMYAAWQARIETSHCAHDVDAFEVFLAILLEDLQSLYGIFIRSGGAIRIARTGIPRGGRIGMVVGDLSIADHEVMRKHTSHGLMEAAADGFIRNFEILEGLDIAGIEARHGLLIKENGQGCRVGDEVSTCPVT